jgi:hypothetical protein
MWRRFTMNRFGGRSGLPFRRRSYGASFSTILLLVSAAVLILLYYLGHIAL